VNQLIPLINNDLQKILDKSRDISLILNASKTHLSGDSVRLSGEKSWDIRGWLIEMDRAGYVISRTFSTLRSIVFKNIRPGILESCASVDYTYMFVH
jgi:hypothetical protein